MSLDIDSISHALEHEVIYPPQMRYVDRGILGHGYYPGAMKNTFGSPLVGGIMLLGRDFGTFKYYQRIANVPGKDETAFTWSQTRDIYLDELAEIPLWCTNYLMGVRSENPSTGNMKDRMNPKEWDNYEVSCWLFFKKQVALQSPSLVVVFGGDNETDLNTASRLQNSKKRNFDVLYMKHPNHAKGHANIALHRLQCATIKARWLKLSDSGK